MRLVPQFKELICQGHFQGHGPRRWINDLAELVITTDTESILDFGCGQGGAWFDEHYHEAWGVRPRCYDPAANPPSWIPIQRDLPKGAAFDGVLCIDVLQCIPPEELPAALEHLKNYAQKWCFVTVSTKPSPLFLPDGTNVNVNLQTLDWWRAKLKSVFKRSPARIFVHEQPENVSSG